MTTDKFHLVAAKTGPVADLVTDLHRMLGDLADKLEVYAFITSSSTEIVLTAPTPQDGELRNSVWHKVVNRISDLFGPGLVVQQTYVVKSRHYTPFAIGIEVQVYRTPANTSTETTLEAVLA